MIVAGVGFSSAASAAEIADLVREALARAGRRADRLATAQPRAALAAFAEAAALLGLPVEAVPPEILRATSGVVSCSTRAQAAHDVGSVAEAAALAAAGSGATLLLARISGARVTCALARSREDGP